MYSSWDIGCGVKHRIPCHLGYFSPFTPPPPPPSNNPAKQNFQKVKKKVFIHYHFAHVHHKWRSYDVWWDMVHDRQIFFFFFFFMLSHFHPFIPLVTTIKIKILKKWKKTESIIILHMYTINDNHMMYSSRDMKHDGQNFLSLSMIFLFFAILPT